MTYSIVARDGATGELAVAVQSHWFAVGPIVPWARPGVGAVATQANAEVSYGPRALELLDQGLGAQETLDRLVAEDPLAATRQVAVLDAHGGVAAHTGSACIPYAGHVLGEGFACQANIMSSEQVWPRMAEAFEAASGELPERLLTTLDAAEDAGGDARGRQSAAILVVPGQGSPWEAQVSLRVEDHPEPLRELRRLLGVHAAYRLAAAADGLVAQGRHREAAELYMRASDLVPQNHELRFWAGLGMALSGDLENGTAQVAGAISQHAQWRDVLGRLPRELAPAAPMVMAQLDRNG